MDFTALSSTLSPLAAAALLALYAVATLVKANRNQQGFAIANGTAATITDGKLKLHALKKGAELTPTRPILTHHHLKL